jgi:hypothetical protein
MGYFLLGYLALSLLAVVVIVCACIASGRASRHQEKWLGCSAYEYEEHSGGLRSSTPAVVHPRPRSVPALKRGAVAYERRQPPRILSA